MLVKEDLERVNKFTKRFKGWNKIIYICYPGLITEDLKNTIRESYNREDLTIDAFTPRDFPELYIRDKEDNEYIIRGYQEQYYKAIDLNLLVSNAEVILVEWIPGLQEHIYSNNYKGTKIIQVMPKPKAGAFYMRYLLEHKAYDAINMVAENYDKWHKSMRDEMDIRDKVHNEEYERLYVDLNRSTTE